MAYHDSLTNPDPKSGIPVQEIVEHSRIIAETASDAIITIDEASRIMFVNGAAEKIFGYSSSEMLGAELTMLMPEYLRHVHRLGLKHYVETGHKHIAWKAVELAGLHKTGKEIPLELSFGEFRVDGRRYFTGIARDITTRRHDQRRLKLQHSVADILSKAANLRDAAPKLLETICTNLEWQFGALWSIEENKLQLEAHWREPSSTAAAEFERTTLQTDYDPKTGLPGKVWADREPIWINNFGQAAFPRSPVAARGNIHSAFGCPVMLGEEVLGVIELFGEEQRGADTGNLNSLLAIGSQISQFIERQHNEQKLVQALAREHEARVEAERLTTRLEKLQRITDAALGHFTVSQVLSESLDRIREVLNVDTVAILLLRTEGDELVAWAAQGLEEEVEQGVRIPVGKGFAGKVAATRKALIIEDTANADLFNPLLREKGIKSLLGVPLMVEGRLTGVLHVGKMVLTKFTEDDVSLLELGADRIALAIENARLYQVEQLARGAAEDANRAKDEFLTILSHELRTPLTPIIGWVHMMRDGILHESDFNRVLSVVNRNAYSLKRLINDLLDMSAILSGKMRILEMPVSIGSVLEESVDTMRSYAEDSKVELRLVIDSKTDGFVVRGDRNRLNQAFCNILHNAIKFSPQNAVVEISCDLTDTAVRIRFSDQGTGISESFLPYVFDRFRQADGSRTRTYGGLGLGLSLVKSFIEAHEGTVEATSKGEGAGSTFEVNLPLETASEPEDARVRTADEAAAQSKAPARILIVEDQPDTLELLTVTLQQRGYLVLACESAAHALEIAGREKPDLLISDIGLRATDGFQLIRDWRKSGSNQSIPAIALTGYASETDVERAVAAGFDLHLSKPFDTDNLLQTVERLLNTPR